MLWKQNTLLWQRNIQFGWCSQMLHRNQIKWTCRRMQGEQWENTKTKHLGTFLPWKNLKIDKNLNDPIGLFVERGEMLRRIRFCGKLKRKTSKYWSCFINKLILLWHFFYFKLNCTWYTLKSSATPQKYWGKIFLRIKTLDLCHN